MKELSYPFDSEYILKNKKKIKNSLMEKKTSVETNIAILGGSTTSEIKNILELFLLNYGIKANFYESEYNKYYEESIFENKKLDEFKPDIIYIHTSNINITNYPVANNSDEEVKALLKNEFDKWETIWNALSKKYDPIIIQSNFELPSYRILGNMDTVLPIGKVNFITRLNMLINNYAKKHSKFYINDINYVSSCYGLDKWNNELVYDMYKYSLDINAIPYLCFNLSNIIKAIYGKNKKAFVLDLDNTLWGGVISEDGVNNIQIGPDTSYGQAYYRFQKYLKEYNDIGIILNINSKNDLDIAKEGLNNPSNYLKYDDFIIKKINWNPKNINMQEIAQELNLGSDSFVFVDDNPAERKIVSDYIKGIGIVDSNNIEDFIRIIDRNGFFEVISLSKEDLNKNNMYLENSKRSDMISKFDNYDDYLKSLNMKAEICTFKDIYLDRITQLTNKSNQFNLTTKRYTISEIEKVNNSDEYIKIYGKLSDIFGDSGVISVVIGQIKNKDELHIDLWIMSCRVLKRNMEFAMMDELISICKNKNINKVFGYYYKTEKNNMVREFYEQFGFKIISESEDKKEYVLNVSDYKKLNNIIEVDDERDI